MRLADEQNFECGEDGRHALDAFRADIRAFLDRELTPDLRVAGRNTTGVHSDISACRTWHSRLFRRGWIAPSWPVAFGGTGWDALRRFVFDQECAQNDAPVLFSTGIRSIGPLLIAEGTEEQQKRFIPRILSGKDLWCQGFSEPNAGSDLVALKTRAKREGEFYVVNGRKIWTTGAHHSNRMFALVRTCSDERPQYGVTFLLIDMSSPGLSVQPIVSIDGQHDFNEIIFDDVRVPASDRVGAENQGWTVAKHLMRFARTNNTTSSLLRRSWRAIERAVYAEPNIETGLELRVSMIAAELTAFESLELSYLQTGRLSGDEEVSASAMKLAATELHQRMTELLLDLSGPYAVTSPAFNTATCAHDRDRRFVVAKYFATRAASIYSGTSEIHRNIIARQLLR